MRVVLIFSYNSQQEWEAMYSPNCSFIFIYLFIFFFLLMSWMGDGSWISDVSNKLWNKQVSFLKLHSWLNGLPGSHLDIVKWLWIAPLISQFQMTRDNQVIKMSPFSTSDTLPLPPHLNNKSALECFLKQEEKKKKEKWRNWLSLYFQVNLISIFRSKDGK